MVKNFFKKFYKRNSQNENFDFYKMPVRKKYNFRFKKRRSPYNYRLSKKVKYLYKNIRSGFFQKLCAKPMNLIDLLIGIGIYKKTLSLKLMFILVPFVVITILDNAVIAIIISTINIFCCALIFSITTTERHEAIVNGHFDYGKYKYIKSYKETVAILLTFFTSTILIVIGHFFLESLVQIMMIMVTD